MRGIRIIRRHSSRRFKRGRRRSVQENNHIIHISKEDMHSLFINELIRRILYIKYMHTFRTQSFKAGKFVYTKLTTFGNLSPK